MKTNTECHHCTKPIYRKPSQMAKTDKSFCSYDCQSGFSSLRVKGKCAECYKDILTPERDIKKSKSGSNFCNRTCATVFNNKIKCGDKNPNYKNGNGSYRNKAFRLYGAKCSNVSCEIKRLGLEVPKKMLDVDHIDSNRMNNKDENLQVLCVWCHAIKTRIS